MGIEFQFGMMEKFRMWVMVTAAHDVNINFFKFY